MIDASPEELTDKIEQAIEYIEQARKIITTLPGAELYNTRLRTLARDLLLEIPDAELTDDKGDNRDDDRDNGDMNYLC